MSHFSRVRTSMVDRDLVVAALLDLGHQPTGAKVVRGWSGRTEPADIVISSSDRHYDVGFRSTSNGYEMVADWYGVRGIDRRRFPVQLQQRYVHRATRSKLEDQGYSLVNEQEDKDGTVRLVLRRMT